jgi:hypothetical protein
MKDADYQREIERCRREIAEIESLLSSGHRDVAGLCLALADWSAELRLLEEERRRGVHPAASEVQTTQSGSRRWRRPRACGG